MKNCVFYSLFLPLPYNLKPLFATQIIIIISYEGVSSPSKGRIQTKGIEDV